MFGLTIDVAWIAQRI